MYFAVFERRSVPKEQHCAGRASSLVVVVSCVDGAQSRLRQCLLKAGVSPNLSTEADVVYFRFKI